MEHFAHPSHSGRHSDDTTTVNLPVCKSTLARWLILEAVDGKATLAELLDQAPTLPDDLRVLRLGLEGGGIDCRDSGTALRLLTAYHAIRGGEHTFTGSERLCQRPISELLDLLTVAGAKITPLGAQGHLPFTLRSDRPLHFPETIDAHHWRSSQYVSALLLSGVRSHILYPDSGPSYAYILLTIRCLDQFGYQVAIAGDRIDIVGRTSVKSPVMGNMDDLPRDWSSAGYWYELLALCPTIPSLEAKSLCLGSHHPDERVVDLYKKHFAITTTAGPSATRLHSSHTEALHSHVEIDLSQSPDLFSAIACTCLGQRRTFALSGLDLLRHKESDRIESFIANAGRLGASGFATTTSTLTWDGTLHPTPSAVIDPMSDHRVAMAFGILAKSGALGGQYDIKAPNVVQKSYPQFWEELHKLLP